jgi:antitoxin component YwqK of YwqJK toxin-antitoxin module
MRSIPVLRVPEEALDYTDEGEFHFKGKPFTGIAFSLADGGSLEAEHEFREGLYSGLSRGWHPSGCLEYEATCSQGLVHGLRREWHESGRLAAEEAYEYGIRVEGRRWDAEGDLIEEYQLQDTDPAHRVLEAYRVAYGAVQSE